MLSSPARRRRLRIAIVGAGIAGLTAALCFAKRGSDVAIMEAANELRPIGAGIQVPPNAWRIVHALGLERELNAAASAPRSIDVSDGLTGQRLTSLPLGPGFERRHGAPYLVVHRGDLQRLLLEAVTRESSITLRLGEPVDDPSAIDADLVVGADGVRSNLRRAVRGPEARAVESGFVAWRAVLDRASLPMIDNARTGLWLGPEAHLVHYPVRSGRSVNVVVIGRANAAGPEAVLRGWCATAQAISASATDWGSWPIASVSPSAAWRRGRVVLVGDAAHAMWPYAAQGGAMAMEDAWTLASAVAAGHGLDIWESLRKRRVSRVAATAARNRFIYHASGPLRLARNAVMRSLPPHILAVPMEAIYTWRPPEVDASVSGGSG